MEPVNVSMYIQDDNLKYDMNILLTLLSTADFQRKLMGDSEFLQSIRKPFENHYSKMKFVIFDKYSRFIEISKEVDILQKKIDKRYQLLVNNSENKEKKSFNRTWMHRTGNWVMNEFEDLNIELADKSP